jgi:predicted RNA-binding Zn ribbon-like protein
MANRPGEVIPAPDDDLCLSYANTRYWRGSAAPTEDLHTLDDLLRWSERTERLPPALVRRFHPSTDIFSDAMGLRETIFRCFAATASGGAPAEDDLAALNAALAAAPARQRVRHGGWDIGTPGPSAVALLAPTLWSAADLLVGNQLARVRQCANPACGWLFLDNSKSGNRRWCSMGACGNRAKAHRHYLRKKNG